ncbi:hypothetical protein L873DRAFT_1844840 [Choiromyces venosus 120613-1]|uniref:Uncharacterized protein n=1 Tax=Choiromyces venosus 120613-1 TaxID=1336337 RepID=A0A3N4JGC4_9PEZI|nr:hypothetical protein L873DRAFT_1844840 [Choiromyces venosus 120613-1]
MKFSATLLLPRSIRRPRPPYKSMLRSRRPQPSNTQPSTAAQPAEQACPPPPFPPSQRSRRPPARLSWAQGHIFYENVSDGVNTRQGTQLLVENNGSDKPLYSTDAGYAVAGGIDFGPGKNTATAGTLKTMPYTYSTVLPPLAVLRDRLLEMRVLF